MRVTRENIEMIPESERGIIRALLLDIDEINSFIRHGVLSIDWQDYHDTYSPERTDPCPDYYGSYRIYKNDNPLGIPMDYDTLDTCICLLYDYLTL